MPPDPPLASKRGPEVQGRQATGFAGAEPAGPLGGQGAPATVGAYSIHRIMPVSQVASTTMPKAMRYQAKGTKVWVAT